ncbi:MAG TPA: Uma2 family endonuclease [Pyrinomonadaceae bacterium]|nr:Uma2 family endonuclease [Pyrinomonadaceae bacterium]
MNETATATTNRNNNLDLYKSTSNDALTPQLHGRWQNLIATNAAVAIGSRVSGGKTEIYVNGMCVQLGAKATSFPSVAIVAGEPKFADDASSILTNPTVVIEIVSGTADISDRAEKLERYLALASIKECFLVRADEMRIEHYARQNAKQWLYRIYDGRDDVVSLDAINCKLSVAEFYAQVKVREASLASRSVH